MLARRGFLGSLLVLASLAGAALAPGMASATQIGVNYFTGNSYFGAGNTPTPNFARIQHMAINQANGNLEVVDQDNQTLDQLDSSGNSLPFSALGGANEINIGDTGGNDDVAVDDSGGSGQGNIYVVSQNELLGYSASGTPLSGNFPISGVIFKRPCGVDVDPQGNIWVADGQAEQVIEFDSAGNPTGKVIGTKGEGIAPCRDRFDAQGDMWVVDDFSSALFKYGPDGIFQFSLPVQSNAIGVDRTDGDVYVDKSDSVDVYDTSGNLVSSFGQPTGPPHSYPGLNFSHGIDINETTHDVYLSAYQQIDVFGPRQFITIPTVTTGATTDPTPTSGTIHGTIDADNGGDTTDCHFDWAFDNHYGSVDSFDHTAPCAEGNVFASASGPHEVHADLTGLVKGTPIHYRLVANNDQNHPSIGAEHTFMPADPPAIDDQYVSKVNTDGALVNATIDPGGDVTGYHVEWGLTDSYGHDVPVPDNPVPGDPFPVGVGDAYVVSHLNIQNVALPITGAPPGTVVHYRVVATNTVGVTPGPDRTFTTFGVNPQGDTCGNAHVRQQTGSALLLDCRAYELVSAPDTGGYDVESTLVPGQTPYEAGPQAGDRVIYSVSDGSIPGIAGDPTNFGLDPYLATRGADGWSTSYVGIPESNPNATGPFASTLGEADATLNAFAFAGDDLCSPCFGDGSTGIPIRLPNGNLVQGMAGSIPVDDPQPAGLVAKHFSADGSHFVFGSADKFEADGNGNGDVSIYDRDLATGVTHVVSKAPGGATLTGSGIGELDISGDGSHIVIGRQLGTDAKGNSLFHLYENVGDSAQSVDLTPGTTSGAHYDGMTADGSKVFFTTADKLVAGDTDTSADVYEADVSGGGAALSLVSTGAGAGNSDACNPVGGWNSAAGGANCDAVALAGGGGVASAAGAVYFLSPEALTPPCACLLGAPVPNQPNLYVKRPADATPSFVATLASTDPLVAHAVSQAATHSYGDFEVTPNGDFAAFGTTQSLKAGYENAGHAEVYRYDAGAGALDCVSCDPTDARATGDSTLSPTGLSLSDDGRVFFTSEEPLSLRDTDGKTDAYEWEGGNLQLISPGTGRLDSALLGISPDATNAFFFTHDALVPQDQSQELVKIYDARANGGFVTGLEAESCKASDECHGPGTTEPGPPDINSVQGNGGNHPIAHKKKHHKKKHHQKRKHRKRHHGGHRHG